MKTTPALNAFFRPALIAVALAFSLPAAQAAVPKDMLVIGKAADPQTLDPAVTIKVRDGINNWLDNHGCSSVNEIIGALED